MRRYFMLHERPDSSGRWVLGFRSAASWTDIDTPIFERYYAGGFTTLRGFDFRGVSPRHDGWAVGGNFEMYNSAELLFPLTADDMIRGVVFVDTGCVQSRIDDWSQKYRIAPGVGVRISIPFMGPAPIAFDFAFPVTKDPSDVTNIFSFYVGFMR
jgi:outer membrane protein insertion porin family